MSERTKEEFMARFKGVKRHILTRACNRATPGINWSGCGKGYIAELWASGERFTRMDKVTLDQLDALVKEEQAK
jgi:hypothetical protein